MEIDFDSLSTEQKYDLLKRVVERVQKEEDNADEYAFQEEEGKVNLIGARGFNNGKACESQYSVYDDTLFAVFKKNGQKHVEAFVYSSEYGTVGTAFLAQGQHKYKLHYHRQDYPASLNLATASSYLSNHWYRALRPYEKVRILRDENRNMKKDGNENYEMNGTINIHYGGENTPGGWSLGCQVIKGWDNYKQLIKLVESDASVKGTIDNELAEKPSNDGTRAVIYTLVTGEFIEEMLRSMSGLAFPIDIKGGRSITNETLESYYYHTEKQHAGGYFPVGANTVWHGGVHIRTSKSDVRACLPGRIVAARLAESEELASAEYGSRNFVLLKHERNGCAFYSLYMHLHANALSSGDSLIKRLHWLGKSVWYEYKGMTPYRCRDVAVNGNVYDERIKKGDKFELIEHVEPMPWKKIRTKKGDEVFVGIPDEYLKVSYKCKPDEALLDQLRSGNIVKLDIEVAADQLLWQSGEYGAEDHRTGLLHWEIFAEENIFPPSMEQEADEAESADKPEQSEAGNEAARPVLASGLEGPANSYQGVKALYRVIEFKIKDPATGKYSTQTPTEKEKKQINWVVLVSGSEVMRKEKHGDVLNLQIADDWKGKTIQVMPYCNSPSDKVSVKTKVGLRRPIVWKAIEDTDNDYNMDSEVILNLFADDQNDGIWESDDNLTSEELAHFYSENKKAERLRAYACRFISEWGIQDLDSAIDKLKGRWITIGLKDRIEPYLWWQEAKKAGCDIPSSPMCWHYNPISVLESLYLNEGMRTTRNVFTAATGNAIRVGVFFDGTGNNKTNDISKGKDTNIVRLYDLYNAGGGGGNSTFIDSGGVRVYTHKIYENGVGTVDNDDDSTYGLVTGAGGVSRIDDALEKLEAYLDSVSGIEGPRTVDIFGFSRGASLARDFVNQVNKKLSEKGVKVGFVGIFDTVASFGIAGNNANSRSDHPVLTGVASYIPHTALLTRLVFGEYQLDLSPASAEKIVHLVAQDEIRANFPLSSLKSSQGAALPENMEEVTVIGVHSDVGGSYGTKPKTEVDRIEKRKIHYQRVNGAPPEAWMAHMQRQKDELEAEAARRGLELLYEQDETTSDAVGNTTDVYWLVKRRSVKPSLSNVYLHWMYKKAQGANVPLLSLTQLEQDEPERFSIPDELRPLFADDLQTVLDAEKVREEYVHRSYTDWEDSSAEKRWIADRAEGDGVRDIYYNDPDDAQVPESPAEAQEQNTMAGMMM